ARNSSVNMINPGEYLSRATARIGSDTVWRIRLRKSQKTSEVLAKLYYPRIRLLAIMYNV
ncbi:MAG: hypothetical protein WD049_02860, partial [Candidatus Paceibacterota bacterium]